MSDFLFDSDYENISCTCAANESSSAGNNLLQRDTNETTDSSNRGLRSSNSNHGPTAENNFKAWLPHNLYKSGSSNNNNNNASCSSSNSLVGPLNLRSVVGTTSRAGPTISRSSRGPRISESPPTNLSLRNVSAPRTRYIAQEQIHRGLNPENLEPCRNHNSGSRAGPSSSFPLLPHEMLAWQDRQRSSEATPGTHEYDAFAPSPFGSSSTDEVGTTSRVRRSSAFVMDTPGSGVNGRDVLSAVEGRERLILQVLNGMHMGPHFRSEDHILIDPFVNGFVELHDSHRDLRLDVDNMSYEELLALEERIGNVNNGLSEGNIGVSMRQHKYEAIRGSLNLEPCSICRTCNTREMLVTKSRM
ncbi:E3 ubiquitin-protein ligase mbr2 [Phtheirospermum japonicum]|uniref:RING-type E3 ubiquitin transferase n=1 Tax=Phtheirospermum japonicum TaxID=374723 RepID=A0A830C1Y6_9LAMI|nr:E3 ubiquitin-protein ligase mbr2 [Phtheirospermum japonicum]